MHLYFTTKPFQYYDKSTGTMLNTYRKIPILIDNNGKLNNIVNDYLLMKTIYSWDDESSTPKTNAEHILSFLDFCENVIKTEWLAINEENVNSYILFLIKEKYSQRTIDLKFSAISMLFSWAMNNNYIIVNPFKNNLSKEISLKYNRNLSMIKIPTSDEIKAFYISLNEEDKLIAMLIIESGLRKEELYQLTVASIKNASISSSGSYFYVNLDSLSMKIKNNKSRFIEISKSMRDSLLNHSISEVSKLRKQKFYQKNNYETDLIFISSQGNKYSSDKLNKSFYKASILSGYYNKHEFPICPDQLRHYYAVSFITRKLQSGVNSDSLYHELSNYLGHQSSDTTKKLYENIVNSSNHIDKYLTISLNMLKNCKPDISHIIKGDVK